MGQGGPRGSQVSVLDHSSGDLDITEIAVQRGNQVTTHH